MNEIENLIKQYLETGLMLDRMAKTANCPSEKVLTDYMEHKLPEYELDFLEEHISGCGFCLSQINLAYEAENMQKDKALPRVSERLIKKIQNFIAADKKIITAKMAKRRKMKKNLFLVATIVFFVLSFVIHRYFMQFLFAALILGFRWALESKNARTLIMVLDSWRKHSHNDDEEIEQCLKNRFSKRDL
jgi:hypothetical protein